MRRPARRPWATRAARSPSSRPRSRRGSGRSPSAPRCRRTKSGCSSSTPCAASSATLARARGVLFYIDDLHWADSGTLWLLGHLLRNLRGERVLVRGLLSRDRARPRASAVEGAGRLEPRAADHAHRAQPLRARRDARAARSPAGRGGRRRTSRDAVHRETEGNPFFVEEVLKALIEQGSVRRESGRWKRDEIARPRHPAEHEGRDRPPARPRQPRLQRSPARGGGAGQDLRLPASCVAVAGERGEDALLDALDEAVARAAPRGRARRLLRLHARQDPRGPLRGAEPDPPAAPAPADGRGARAPARGAGRSRSRSSRTTSSRPGEHERGLVFAKRGRRRGRAAVRLRRSDRGLRPRAECAETLGLRRGAGRARRGDGQGLHDQREHRSPALEHFERALALTTDPRMRAPACRRWPRTRWSRWATRAASTTCARRWTCWIPDASDRDRERAGDRGAVPPSRGPAPEGRDAPGAGGGARGAPRATDLRSRACTPRRCPRSMPTSGRVSASGPFRGCRPLGVAGHRVRRATRRPAGPGDGLRVPGRERRGTGAWTAGSSTRRGSARSPPGSTRASAWPGRTSTRAWPSSSWARPGGPRRS